MNLAKFESQIQKTGFYLENQVARVLRSDGWTVISNRYYVDDQEEAVREIDLVAYRARRGSEFTVVTTLIISCKKSEKNVWALLARDVDLDNPNYDWWPTHIWSNDRAASFVFGEPGWRKQYHERARELGVRRALSDPAVDIFAFQEMNRDSGTPQNDKPIFASVTSLMKAQSYELEALPQRKPTPLVYQFNLLTVVDADLVRIHFDDIGVRSSPVVEEQYIASYIIKKRHTIARIHFVNSAEFPAVVKDYGRLHKANITIFREASKFFYEDLLTDSNRVVLFADDFKQAVSLDLTSRLRRHASNHRVLDSVCVAWNELERRADVYVAAYDDDLKFLTEDKKARQIVAKALKDIYRFDGPFEFVEDIPF